jgi:Na+-translocating ferredoxin:NAD+ oxidoreductase RnfD subunit
MKTAQVSALIVLLFCIVIFTLDAFGGQNHYGFHPRTCGYTIILVSTILFFVLKAFKHTSGLTVVLLVVSLILGVMLLAFDHFNIIVNYDEWLKRGMPESPLK